MKSRKANRTTAFDARKQAKSTLDIGKADAAAARAACDAAEAARDARKDELRDAEVALEEGLKKMAAMKK